MKLLGTISLLVLLLLSGCAFTNQWLDMSGDRGTREDLPVRIEELVERATYCKDIYDKSLEIFQNFKHLSAYTIKYKKLIDLKTEINKTLKEDPPASIKKGNVIKSGIDYQLDDYRDILNNEISARRKTASRYIEFKS